MNWKIFVSTFTLIFFAELPDKTAFATLLMATRGNPYAIFIGVAAAFLVQSAVAVAFGSALSLLPRNWVHGMAGVLFLVFGGMAWRRSGHTEEEDEKTEEAVSSQMHFPTAVWKSFLVIFVAEWGDLTQLATASMAARYQSPWTIFSAATFSLWSVTALAIFAGHQLKHVIHPKLLDRVGALAFAGVGLYFLSGIWR